MNWPMQQTTSVTHGGAERSARKAIIVPPSLPRWAVHRVLRASSSLHRVRIYRTWWCPDHMASRTFRELAHPDRDELQLTAVLAALSDPVRMRIVADLASL